jgi:hypothetical protein
MDKLTDVRLFWAIPGESLNPKTTAVRIPAGCASLCRNG